ncbi:phosphoribosylformylglycinamidine synthase I [Hymenobacter daecheongensis DSM 21074]|uniref:Phosphoribosylformylglycinamidine synthase I n=1 Tax=Hymenobacter daecheongensis DSM 21074 TaxID=1121955 RepID=A0A1M6L5G7_9BACT|nr:phosphoribosylformylglycinamidine synthase subunit PurQ [Hymenobacter daecheongensis]SHJ66457.1 phosphoribosylformylglycinamidine synthase I [Hymenobacter daecheongensis DSM 21074]
MEQNPQLPDQHTPPRPQHDDPGHEVVDREGNIVLPGFKSVDPGHETTEPLKSTEEEPKPPKNERRVRALILTGFGINCEEEFAAAYRLVGGEATIVHLNQVLHGHVSIHDYDILNFPGGFSFGDDLGSGVVLANKLRYRRNAEGRTLLDDIRQFVADGKHVLGICNGFQVLVKLGLLPDLSGTVTPEVTLTHNASGRYEDRWVKITVNPRAITPFLKGLTTLEVPVRHGEGRLIISDEATRAAIEARGLNCLTYTDFDGAPTDAYPFNPNGADLNCAGLTDTTGRVFGLMPHPEAFLSLYNHPDWARRKRADAGLSEEGDGLRLFRNIVEHVAALPGGPLPPAPSPKGRGSLTTFLVADDYKESVLVVEEPAGDFQTAQEHIFTTTAQKWKTLGPWARENRKQPTEAEAKLWDGLRREKLGVQFRRQHAIDSYIVDFVCLSAKLIVEADGEIHTDAEQAAYDQDRTSVLQELGYEVLRFNNQDILHHTEEVLHQIQSRLIHHQAQ